LTRQGATIGPAAGAPAPGLRVIAIRSAGATGGFGIGTIDLVAK